MDKRFGVDGVGTLVEEEEKEIPSRVLITFATPGSALFSIEFDGVVYSQQMLALAKHLEIVYGNKVLAAELQAQVEDAEKRRLQSIHLPNDGIVTPKRN